jgi:hypothetical protein
MNMIKISANASIISYLSNWSRDSSGCIAMGHGSYDPGIEVRFPEGERDSPLLHSKAGMALGFN